MTPYQTVYKRFENKIEDLAPVQLEEAAWTEMLLEYLESALAFMELDQLKIEHDLSLRDNESCQFEEDLSNAEIEVLSLYMVVAWYDPIVNSLENTNLFYGSKDEKWSNQEKHAQTMSAMQEKYRKRARKYIRNHSSRNNSYLNGDG